MPFLLYFVPLFDFVISSWKQVSCCLKSKCQLFSYSDLVSAEVNHHLFYILSISLPPTRYYCIVVRFSLSFVANKDEKWSSCCLFFFAVWGYKVWSWRTGGVMFVIQLVWHLSVGVRGTLVVICYGSALAAPHGQWIAIVSRSAVLTTTLVALPSGGLLLLLLLCLWDCPGCQALNVGWSACRETVHQSAATKDSISK